MSSHERLGRFFLLVLIFFQQTTTLETTFPCQLPDETVNTFEIRLPRSIVPSNLTTYVCHTQNIQIDVTIPSHIIGFEPLIANQNVVHHMILFGCPYSVGPTQDKGLIQPSVQPNPAFLRDNCSTLQYIEPTLSPPVPHQCSAEDNRCRNFLVQWSKGIEGPICSPPQAGVPIGFVGSGSILSMMLQVHWNNENGNSSIADDSGFRIYFTSKLRRHNLGNLQIGQNDLEIPPAKELTLQAGSCSAECTSEWLDHPIYLTRAHIHMHYLGNGGSMSLFRAGKEVLKIFEDTTYSYTKPPAHYFVKPIKVMPGDEIKVSCYFNSKDGIRKRNRTVYWGEGSDSEMCYAFVTYYPKVPDFDQCIQFSNQDICPRISHSIIGECVFPGFIHIFESGLAGEIIKHCTDAQTGSQSKLSCNKTNKKLCSNQCLKSVREVTDQPCMQGRLEATARRRYLPKIPIWPKVEAVLNLLASNCCKEKA